VSVLIPTALLTWCVVDADEKIDLRYHLIFYGTRLGDGGEVYPFTHHLPSQHLTPVSDAGGLLLLPVGLRVEETRRRGEGGRCWQGVTAHQGNEATSCRQT
jgi:hypothetical protein